MRRWLATLAPMAVLLGVAGCGGGLYPVSGRVVFEDGSPLDEGVVICELNGAQKPVMARGTLQRDGSFRLGTSRPGGGAPPGQYRVLVVPRSLNQFEQEKQLPPIIDRKFEAFETSGLTLEVKQGNNELNITVSKPKQGRRPKAGGAATRPSA
jgi:hypothetical protein